MKEPLPGQLLRGTVLGTCKDNNCKMNAFANTLSVKKVWEQRATNSLKASNMTPSKSVNAGGGSDERNVGWQKGHRHPQKMEGSGALERLKQRVS